MKKLLLTSLMIVFASAAFGQHRLGLEVGTDYFVAKDKTVSSLVYSGFIPRVTGSFSFQGKKMVHQFQLHFGTGNIENRVSNSWQIFTAGIYHYSGYKIQGNQIIKAVGFATGVETVAYTPQFYVSNISEEGNASGYVSAFMGAFANTAFILAENWELEAKGVLPILEYTIRSGYATSTPDELVGTDVPTFGEFVRTGDWNFSLLQPRLFLDLDLVRKSSGAFTFRFGYGFSFRSYNKPLKFSSFNQNLTIGVIWQW